MKKTTKDKARHLKAASKKSPAANTNMLASPIETATISTPKTDISVMLVRGLLLIFALCLPILYDKTVPEVAGDIRWSVTQLVAGVAGLLLLARGFFSPQPFSALMRMPGFGWLAIAFLLWNCVSMIDNLNILRGIPLLKALASYVLLGFCTAMVWSPRFGRAMMWALALPVAFVSVLGICHFYGLTDLAFKYTVLPSWLAWAWPENGIITAITGYFLQSAIPGSSFANKNLAGSWLALVLPIVLYLLLTTRWRLGRFVASGLLAVGVLFLIYSRARASWVSLVFALLVLAGVLLVTPAWRQALWQAMAMPTGKLGSLLPARMTPYLGQSLRLMWLLPAIVLGVWQFNTVSPLSQVYAINSSPSTQMSHLAEANWDDVGGRLAYNLNSLAITRDYWFNGVGLGSFFVIYPAYHDAVVPTPLNSYSVQARPQRTHTDLMQAFDETGILGGLLFLSLFICAAYCAYGAVGRTTGVNALVLCGTGYALMITLIALLLLQEAVFARPSWEVIIGFGGAALVGAVYLLRSLWRQQPRALPVVYQNQTQGAEMLFPLFGGMAITSLFTNCLMDFPLQLPTAPTTVAMLMGGVAMAYRQTHAQAPQTTPLEKITKPMIGLLNHYPRMFVGVLWLILAGLTIAFAVDNYYFRKENQVLKQAMIRVMSNAVDDTTLQLITQANAIYPYDPRAQEYLGVTLANYNGSAIIDVDTRIAGLEKTLQGDPWGANHMINTIGQYLTKANQLYRANQTKEAEEVLKKADILITRLRRVAGFSHYPDGLAGMISMLRGDFDKAERELTHCLRIAPDYTPARLALQQLETLRQAEATERSN